MKSFNRAEYEQLCRDACDESFQIWQAHSDLSKEDALWWAVYKRVCAHIGIEPAILSFGDTPAARFQHGLLKLENLREEDFDTLKIAAAHIKNALAMSGNSEPD